MAHPQIIFAGYFSSLFPNKILIPNEPIYHLSQLKFYGEDGTSITEHITNFLKFCEYCEINDEYFSCVAFFLNLKGHVN